jgi:hypothetical protein
MSMLAIRKHARASCCLAAASTDPEAFGDTDDPICCGTFLNLAWLIDRRIRRQLQIGCDYADATGRSNGFYVRVGAALYRIKLIIALFARYNNA